MVTDPPPAPGELCRCGHLAEEHKVEAPGKWSTICLGGADRCACYRFQRVELPLSQFRR
jgi:hypothetical protein